MLFLVAGVQIGIVGLTGLDHLPEDFQEPLAQAAQGAVVAFAFRPFLFVINFGPRADPHTALGPQMDGMAQHFVALVADADPVDLAGLETDRGRAGDALQGLGVLEALGAAGIVSSALPVESPAGSLDEDPGMRPQAHIFVGSKAPWFEITDQLPQFKEFPS